MCAITASHVQVNAQNVQTAFSFAFLACCHPSQMTRDETKTLPFTLNKSGINRIRHPHPQPTCAFVREKRPKKRCAELKKVRGKRIRQMNKQRKTTHRNKSTTTTHKFRVFPLLVFTLCSALSLYLRLSVGPKSKCIVFDSVTSSQLAYQEE